MIDEDALKNIEKLHQLKQDGVITESEFDAAKQDLLQPRPRHKAYSAVKKIEKFELPGDEDAVGWVLMSLKRFSDFEGRSCRKEFWIFQALYIGLIVISLVMIGEDNSGIGGPGIQTIMAVSLFAFALIALFIPNLALQVRRFHDQDKSGWFALLNLVPYVGPFIIMGFMLVDGTVGDNQYGPDPKNRE